ncbi:hypothetical protein GW17_00032517 [Ensete ventricosum]|nr:hypothetical protein GW17_00032517 [Ensete ventricosum]
MDHMADPSVIRLMIGSEKSIEVWFSIVVPGLEEQEEHVDGQPNLVSRPTSEHGGAHCSAVHKSSSFPSKPTTHSTTSHVTVAEDSNRRSGGRISEVGVLWATRGLHRGLHKRREGELLWLCCEVVREEVSSNGVVEEGIKDHISCRTKMKTSPAIRVADGMRQMLRRRPAAGGVRSIIAD